MKVTLCRLEAVENRLPIDYAFGGSFLCRLGGGEDASIPRLRSIVAKHTGYAVTVLEGDGYFLAGVSHFFGLTGGEDGFESTGLQYSVERAFAGIDSEGMLLVVPSHRNL